MGQSPTPGLTELMRRFTDTLERRDFDRALRFFGPDPEWDMSAMGMGTFNGPVAIRGLLAATAPVARGQRPRVAQPRTRL
jgi:limonene-1,2-epoxide hydrolase